MYRLITARTHYYAPAANIVMAVAITGEPSVDELTIAIQKAVSKHEIFSNKVILDNNGDCFYLAIKPRSITLNVKEMKEEADWKKLVNEQERIPFDFQNGELLRFFLLTKRGNRKLLLVANHLAGDGLAILFLIRDIMTFLDNPELQCDMLPVQLMDDFGYPKDSKLNPFYRLILKQINQSWIKNKKIFRYEEFTDMFRSYWKNRQLGIADETISDTDLQNLITKCRENRVTVNSAIAAAFLLAAPGENEIGMAVSVRPEGYEGMGNFASGISVQYEPDRKKSFWKNAKKIHKLIYKKLKKNEEKYFVLQFLKGLEPTLIDASYFSSFAGFYNKQAAKVREWFSYNEKQQLAFGVSNLAKPKLPCRYGKYGIEDIKFVPPLMPNNKVVIGIVTIGNKMTITMQYEKKQGYEKSIKAFKDAIRLLKLKTISSFDGKNKLLKFKY